MELVRLTGPRLTLREYRHTPEEVEALHAVFGDPVAARYLPFEPRDADECADQIAYYLEEAEREPRTYYRLAVVRTTDGEDGTPIGQAAFTRDGETAAFVGYALRRDVWGRGYAGEITALLCEFGFGKLGLHRLEARIDPDNTASARVVTRAGFELEGRIRHELQVGGEWRDSLQYSLLEPEWRAAEG
ncbi:GNAT family protein [Kitasatospora paracochleata]|uniref:RimJ/RimL family protein N-acetyltransferase n=1 Tax=Kitasatospora paracochleata TaxID=58354 RepID=A0ABT1IPC9_9ACTN|nr:GNAT family protein [Kitasatospora paracochleata]MCP2306981.1 RimJ/RimL family protein N-acetyltransferase [Kitasatospora paracochleata]